MRNDLGTVRDPLPLRRTRSNIMQTHGSASILPSVSVEGSIVLHHSAEPLMTVWFSAGLKRLGLV